MSDPEERINQLIAEVHAMESYGRLPEHLGVRRAAHLREIIYELYSAAFRAQNEAGRLRVVLRNRRAETEVGVGNALRAAGRRVRLADRRTENARRTAARDRAKAKVRLQSARGVLARAQHEAAQVIRDARSQAEKVATVDVTDFDPHGYFVYILWGDEAPLYVGQSSNILSRLGTHLGDGKKRPHVRRVTVTRCETRRDMDALERRLIRQHRPPWNRVGYTKIIEEGAPDSDFSLTSTAS